jgi:hypothetical protein
MEADTKVYFEDMTASLSPADCTNWEQEIQSAEAERISRPAAMDILGAQSAGPDDYNVGQPRHVNTDAERWIDLALTMEQWQ